MSRHRRRRPAQGLYVLCLLAAAFGLQLLGQGVARLDELAGRNLEQLVGSFAHRLFVLRNALLQDEEKAPA